MKVLLLKDVRGVGMHGTVKEVSDGYARNFLLPNKLAEVATEEKMKQVEAQAAAREAERKTEEDQLNKKIASLRGKTLAIAARATEKGGLFKTITPAEVAKAIRTEHSLEVPESAIEISTPIKTVGEHSVYLRGTTEKADIEKKPI
jgi:large subunit ribosomal protein L9